MAICDRAFASLMFTWFPGIRLPVLTADTQICLWYGVVVHFNGSDRNQVRVEQRERWLSSHRQSFQESLRKMVHQRFEPHAAFQQKYRGESVSGLRQLSFVGRDD